MNFEGKVVLITGSTTGIGEACARAFSAAGASIMITGRNAERGERVRDDLLRQGGAAAFVQANIGDDGVCDSLVTETVKHFARLDVLVNNAGIFYSANALETTDGQWRDTFNVNVDALFFLSRAAVRQMLKQHGGCIVNVASEWGLNGENDHVAYCASKGAVVQITRCMALDHAADGIRVNSVCPGETHTQMMDDILKQKGGDFDESLKDFARGIPIGRIADPAEVARCVLFLASEDASYVTGVNFPVDGGNDATGGVYP